MERARVISICVFGPQILLVKAGCSVTDPNMPLRVKPLGHGQTKFWHQYLPCHMDSTPLKMRLPLFHKRFTALMGVFTVQHKPYHRLLIPQTR